MALIPDEDIQKVIEANDLVQIASEVVPDLKQKSGKFMACCPFHKEKTPSFQIDPNLQLFYCFGCHEGGNLVKFVEKIYDMNFPEAIEFLAEKANIEIHRTGGQTYSKSDRGRLMEACKLSAEFYHLQLMKVKSAASNSARKYLGSRNMGSEVAKRWNLGFAPGNNELTKYLIEKKFSKKDLLESNLCVERNGRLHDRFFNRIMFPIKDAQGNVIAFGGRITDDSQPKYLNSNENALFHKSKVLYGLDKAKENMTATGTAIVVEGYTDVIALHESGINYAVATLGTALTRQHIRILNQHAKNKIVYLFDGDEAGQRAAERALNFIDQMERPEVYNKRAELVALTLPDNMDPKEFIDAQGVDALKKLIDEAKPLIQYGIERKIKNYDIDVPGNKAWAAKAALQILAPIKESLLAKEYCNLIADKTNMRVDDLIEELAKIKAPTEYVDKSEFKIDSSKNSKPKLSSVASKFENELLCVFATHPGKIKEILEDGFDYIWKVESHGKIYEFIMSVLKENPSIKANELIMKIHQKNQRTANMLTKMSERLDIKGNPVLHGKFLIMNLYYEDLVEQIANAKSNFESLPEGAEKDKAFKELYALQIKQNEYKMKVNEMV